MPNFANFASLQQVSSTARVWCTVPAPWALDPAPTTRPRSVCGTCTCLNPASMSQLAPCLSGLCAPPTASASVCLPLRFLLRATHSPRLALLSPSPVNQSPFPFPHFLRLSTPPINRRSSGRALPLQPNILSLVPVVPRSPRPTPTAFCILNLVLHRPETSRHCLFLFLRHCQMQSFLSSNI